MTTRAFDVGRSVASGYRERLRRAAGLARESGVDVMLVTPSKDYAYLLGYSAPAMERLTCLVVPADGDPGTDHGGGSDDCPGADHRAGPYHDAWPNHGASFYPGAGMDRPLVSLVKDRLVQQG